MEEHEHGPECEAQAAQYRRQRASVIVNAFEDEKKDALLQTAHRIIERIRLVFEDLDLPAETADQVTGRVAEAFGQVLSQAMQLPAYELSDSLINSSSAYTVAAAHLLAGFELPERAEDPSDLESWADFLRDHIDDVEIISDDLRPGNYL